MTITAKSTIKVKEWFFDKVNEAASAYNTYIVCEYTDGVADHTRLRVEEVLGETGKAYKVAIDAETASGSHKTWMAWIPKSVIED